MEAGTQALGAHLTSETSWWISKSQELWGGLWIQGNHMFWNCGLASRQLAIKRKWLLLRT